MIFSFVCVIYFYFQNSPSSASIPFGNNNLNGGESVLLEHATIFHNNNLNNQVVEEGRTKREAYADGDEIFNNVSDEDDDAYAMHKRDSGRLGA